MADHIETVDPEILNNFVSVALGLRFTVEGLRDVIVDSMATVHKIENRSWCVYKKL
jgi:uncharacterized protein (DUF2164 family)